MLFTKRQMFEQRISAEDNEVGMRNVAQNVENCNNSSPKVVDEVPSLGDVDAVQVRSAGVHERGLTLDSLPARLPLVPLDVARVQHAERVVVLLAAMWLVRLHEPTCTRGDYLNRSSREKGLLIICNGNVNYLVNEVY